jgi:hypothetical protein
MTWMTSSAPTGQLGGGDRVAVGDHRGERQADQQPGAGRLRRRAERGEHPGPDHRPQPDHHRIAGTQPAR